jgi:hypothetical protein
LLVQRLKAAGQAGEAVPEEEPQFGGDRRRARGIGARGVEGGADPDGTLGARLPVQMRADGGAQLEQQVDQPGGDG